MANFWTWLPGRGWTLAFVALFAGALIAAACSDDDFAGAPDDRGAAAAAQVGIVEESEAEAAQVEAEQAGEPEAMEAEEPVAPVEEEAVAAEAGIVEEGAVEEGEVEAAQVEAEQAGEPGAEPVVEAEAIEAEEPVAPVEEEAVAVELLADPERGRDLFFANGCNICHGDTGEGLIGPTIASTGFSLNQVIEQYRSPRGFMPAFQDDKVSDDEIADIFSWLSTLELPENIVPGQGTP